ncbi:hypothetical protein TCE0_018r05007 [Talaromyces pinophilus]|uniref:Amidase domain-containing protein n=1 Tax=Talaromyces pinophilus TaxID=128442 RepID=A0A510NV62_TALPI|nr:hypothetical protein TCE0_018r05007 [Talaromyces pinophilus]
MTFDVLTTTAVDLQQFLTQQKLTSVQILESYFAQIDRHEPLLNALISPAPRDKLLTIAAALDAERKTSGPRSPFHGIPIVLKDSFVTASELGMSTTAGSRALIGSELAGMKMTMMMPGWSAHGGQTLSPYVGKMEENEKLLGHSAPGGSSTGSAVSVAAGFAPLAMGTETIGSIVTPSTRAALYALKPTVGIQDSTGLYCMTEFFDSPGPMAKSAADVCVLTEILLGRKFDLPAESESNIWEGIEVGFLDPKVWKMADDFCTQFEGTAEQMVDEYEETVSNLRSHGCSLKYPISLMDTSALKGILAIAYWDFKNICIPAFIESFDECPISSVADIVRYNKENHEIALPAPFTEQNDLESAINNTETKQNIDKLKHDLRSTARQILDGVFDGHQVSLIAASGDSPLCIHAAAAGYPIATVPIGQLRYNNRPFGLCIVAKGNDEETLLRFMSAYGKVAKPRPVPNL